MKEKALTKANAYKGINELALKNEIVIYGSTYMANFPFYELGKKCHLEHAVYNRSIEELTLEEALELLPVCVLNIKPSKIFLFLGEEDYDKPNSITVYNMIVRKIRAELPSAKLYLICIPTNDNKSAEFNKNIINNCDDKSIFCIKFSPAILPLAAQYKKRFKELSGFFRSFPLGVSEIFAMADL